MLKVTHVTGRGHVLQIKYTLLGHEYEIDHYDSNYPDFDWKQADPILTFIQNGSMITVTDHNIVIDVQDLINEKLSNQGAAVNAVARELYAQETCIENFVFGLARKLEQLNPDFERKELWDILQKKYYDKIDNTRRDWDNYLAKESESLHMGDCTKFACTCTKCEFEEFIRKSQKIFLIHL